MYGIFTYIYHTNQLNVGTYTIHGWYGFCHYRNLYTFSGEMELGMRNLFFFQHWQGVVRISRLKIKIFLVNTIAGRGTYPKMKPQPSRRRYEGDVEISKEASNNL